VLVAPVPVGVAGMGPQKPTTPHPHDVTPPQTSLPPPSPQLPPATPTLPPPRRSLFPPLEHAPEGGIPILSLITPPASPKAAGECVSRPSAPSRSPHRQEPPRTRPSRSLCSSDEVRNGLPRPPRVIYGVPNYPSSIATRRAERADRAWWARLLASDKRRRERAELDSNRAESAPYKGKAKGPAKCAASNAGSAGPSRPTVSTPRRRGKGVGKRRPSAREFKKVDAHPDSEEPEHVCAFCPKVNRTGDTLPSPVLCPLTKGFMRQKVFLHHVCAMWAPEVDHDPETDRLCHVISAYQRSRGLKCSVCGDNDASVGCYVTECARAYHFCCLYGSPPPCAAHPKNVGLCVRHDAYYAPFCPEHASRANDDEYMRRMKADAEETTFLAERAAAVHAALNGHPEQGKDCPNYHITGLRRNETETIFSRVWGIASEAAEAFWVTVATRPQRPVLQRGERLSSRHSPRRVPRSALADALRAPLATDGEPAGAATATVAASGDSNGTRTRRAAVFLLRNLRRYRGPALRRSLPTVPSCFLSTHVAKGLTTKPSSPETETESGEKQTRGRCAGAGGGGAASADGDGLAGGGAGGRHHRR